MYKILNNKEFSYNLRHGLPTPYQDDFDEDYNYIELNNIKYKSGNPLEFTVYKYEDIDNYYIEYSNHSALHGAYNGCSYFTNLGGYHQTFKDNFDNYYSSYNRHKGLPPQLLDLISEDNLAVFFISNKENIDKDIKKLTDFLIKVGIVVEGDSLK